MAVPTDTLELANILVECDLPREHAEMLATKLSEKFAEAASESDLERQLAIDRERSDARFERHMAEMRAHLDQRFAEVDARFEQIDARFERLEERMAMGFERVDARFEQVDERFKQVDDRFKQVDERFKQVDARFEQVDERFKLAPIEAESRFAQFEVRVYRAVAIGTGLILAAISIWGAFG